MTTDSDRPIARIAVTVAALTVGAVAMWGSAAALTEIGREDRVAAPWTLPLCLDALSLVCVAAGVFAGQSNWWVRWGPRLGYTASAVLQVTDALEHGRRAPFTHIAALAAALILSEVVMSMWRPEDTSALVLAEDVDGEPSASPVLADPSNGGRAARSRGLTPEDIAARIVAEGGPRTVRGVKDAYEVGDTKARAALKLVPSEDDPHPVLGDASPEDTGTGTPHLEVVHQ